MSRFCTVPGCIVCDPQEEQFVVAPLASIKAIRGRTTEPSPIRDRCPRCSGALGCREAVVDSVGYAHLVRPCSACAALWVL